jgi:hypothetical protein
MAVTTEKSADGTAIRPFTITVPTITIGSDFGGATLEIGCAK